MISPAKTFAAPRSIPSRARSTPALLPEAEKLIEELKEISSLDLCSLMGISDELGELNAKRFATWKPNRRGGKPALYAFGGDVYRGLNVGTFSAQDITSAQRRLRILSGLYGVLKPMDVIHPYRLEMGTAWGPDNGNSLYEHWRPQVTEILRRDLDRHRVAMLVNLASDEYVGAIDHDLLRARVIKCRFLQEYGDGYRFMSFYGKRARGLMASHIVRNRIETIKGLKEFSDEGYYFSKDRSSRDSLVFLRDTAP